MHYLPKANDGDPQCDQHNTEKQHAPSSNRKGACPNKPWQHFRMLWENANGNLGSITYTEELSNVRPAKPAIQF